jgi:hypothetical protein
MRKLKNRFKKLLFNINRVSGVERQGNLLGEIRADQILKRGPLNCLADAEFSVHSQWGEDGILSWLVSIINPAHTRFVEFGVEDYRESNTRFLLMTRNWSGMVIDGSEENVSAIRSDAIAYKYDLKPVCSFITRENIAELLQMNGFDAPLGILSVDIDGVDYWVLEAIKTEADIVVVEYNSIFGKLPVSVPYDSGFVRLLKHWSGAYCGASLSAFNHLLNARNMTFVGSNKAGTNAFFVQNKHMPRMVEMLKSFKEWPCVMREVRNSDGSLAYKNYAESKHLIADLPVVDVKTGQQSKFKDL